MTKLDTLRLRVRDVAAQKRFYCDVLGMSDQGDGRVGYCAEETALLFTEAEAPYTPQATDLYWKIALSVPNIELACAQLQARGVYVTGPQQFRDVGYLAKLTDPEGFVIELIDHWFEGDRPDLEFDESRLGGGPHLSLVTLRAGDITAIEPDILSWGMTPLSVQPVEPFGFTLYFYAFTTEQPPNPDLTGVENRTWTYQRPYTVLEIQHVSAVKTESLPEVGAAGYGGLIFGSAGAPIHSERLMITAY
ncbi:Glyoxalase-like domain protein [Pseudovibrio sp. Ad5]|uniref:VOC family protein n=1 Tax=Pseudovibrio sp. Ad5 TaxID=989436 RepID=UPI0007AE4B08|nr:VOC family protein [Pseudovibrio sp. Ad5]KZL01651.1 Glyoxalase-like domain protein [Pseudovibrio sp. Ad5]